MPGGIILSETVRVAYAFGNFHLGPRCKSGNLYRLDRGDQTVPVWHNPNGLVRGNMLFFGSRRERLNDCCRRNQTTQEGPLAVEYGAVTSSRWALFIFNFLRSEKDTIAEDVTWISSSWRVGSKVETQNGGDGDSGRRRRYCALRSGVLDTPS